MLRGRVLRVATVDIGTNTALLLVAVAVIALARPFVRSPADASASAAGVESAGGAGATAVASRVILVDESASMFRPAAGSSGAPPTTALQHARALAADEAAGSGVMV